MNPKKELISQAEVKTAETGNFCLKYYLLSSHSECYFSNESPDGILYGIAIKKEALHKGSVIAYEEESIWGFSYCKEEALKQILIYASMLVTPATLLYIADDYFSKIQIIL